MFVNAGNGEGLITYAPITNYKDSSDLLLPEQFKKWLTTGLEPELKEELGKKIQDGISNYFPAMKNAVITDVLCGVVKTKGSNINIADPNSDVHKRQESGIEVKDKGWIDNACMKFFSCEHNSNEVLHIINDQEASLYDSFIPNIEFTGEMHQNIPL
jgi:hypothetical protein